MRISAMGQEWKTWVSRGVTAVGDNSNGYPNDAILVAIKGEKSGWAVCPIQNTFIGGHGFTAGPKV
jgi:hypothetical protein